MSHKLLPHEIEYIRSNCLTKSDILLGKELNRDAETIKRARKKLGILKTQAGKVANLEQIEKTGLNLNEAGRKEFFKTQLTNSVYYDNIRSQFTKEEIDFYLEEWAGLCMQFEDILQTEKRQIDEFIKAEILGNRILRNNQNIEKEIQKLQKETEDLYQKHKQGIITDEEARERDEQLMIMTRTMSSQCQQIGSDYQKNVDLRSKLLDNLNARRRDRTEQLRKSGTTFLGLISAFREKEVRDVQGRYMELMRLAKEKKKAEFRREVPFPDGSKECILLDDQSEVSEKHVVLMEDMGSKLVKQYRNDKDKLILIIENDIKRIQLFQEVFKNHTLDYVSEEIKAVGLLDTKKYDLICLDYDLNFSKSDKIANMINEHNPEADILIHSMNKAGVERLKEILQNKNMEIFPFEDIRSFLKKEEEYNAASSN